MADYRGDEAIEAAAREWWDDDGVLREGTVLAKSFRELRVYVAALEASTSVFLLTKRFPSEEKYSLTDQIRRSSRAVGSMIAEAWPRRRYKAAFVSKLNDALGEGSETQCWLDHALRCGYMSIESHSEHDRQWQRIGGMLTRAIQLADSFCDPNKE
jgi:four helix bundle protein